MAEGNGNGGGVSYTVKELVARMDGKLDSILLKLEGKAEAASVSEISGRVASLELWRAALAASEGTRDKISAKQLVVWGIVATVAAGTVGAIATLVWLAVSAH